MVEENKKLKLNKEMSMFNKFVVINVFDKIDNQSQKLLTIKSVYKPRNSEFWKSSDFINIKQIDNLIDMLNELKLKLSLSEEFKDAYINN